MKSLNLFLLLLFFSSLSTVGYSQQDCKVLVPAISNSYVGKCKKGLAHGKGKAFGVDKYEGMFRKGLPNGKGTYTWSTGERYEGQWIEGQRNGVGVYIVKIDGKDSITAGIWDNGEYIGPVPDRPQVLGSVAVDKYRFSKRGDGQKVMIDIYINGNCNTDLENFALLGSSGNDIRMGHSIGLDNVSFPFTCKVSYLTWNKAHSAQHYSKFEFKISEPGNWLVVIHN